MAKALAVARTGFRRLFSISAFTPPPPATVPPSAEPSPNLFVSGTEIEALIYTDTKSTLEFLLQELEAVHDIT